MKKLILLLSLFVATNIMAQAPESFNYQAVIRDGSGAVLPNKVVQLKIGIYETSTAGVLRYEETHLDTTNSLGLLSMQIGTGTVVSGSMSSILWANDVHVMKIEIDPDGGTNYERLSTTQLHSVPYSLHSNTAGYAPDEDADSTNEIQLLSMSNDTLFLSNGGGFAIVAPSVNLLDNDSTNELITSASLSNDTLMIMEQGIAHNVDLSTLNQSAALSTLQSEVNAGAYKDSSATNEIQMISISNDTIYLSNGGFAVVPGGAPNLDNDSTNEIQMLSMSNDTIYLNRNGGFAVIPASAPNLDNDSTNEIQVLSISNDTIYLSDGGFAVLPASAVNLDNDSTNEWIQSATLSNDTLTLNENGNMTTVALAGVNYWSKSGNNLYYDAGKVGVGSSASNDGLLSVIDTSEGIAGEFESYSLGVDTTIGLMALAYSYSGDTNKTFGLWGRALASTGTPGTGSHVGVLGSATGGSNYGAGVFGTSTGSSVTNLSRGVDGYSNNSSSTYNQGVYGGTNAIRVASTGYNSGVVGEASGHSQTNYAVVGLMPALGNFNYGGAFFSYGNVSGAKKNYGAYGYAWGADTNLAIYAYAADDATALNYGVYSQVSGSSSLAGYFIGNVTISGNLSITGSISKGSGTFKIDHPQDPENKYLVHSFVESPDMMNVYNGNVTTDANGIAVVELPDYVEPNNKDFRYQLTPIGDFAQCIIKEEVSNNRFVIATDKPNVKVSWQVTGIRNDPYAQQNRIVPVQDKTKEEKGLYLHPDAYGQDESKAIYKPIGSDVDQEKLEELKKSGSNSSASPNGKKD